MDEIINDFYALMQGVNLNALGILDASDNIHSLGTDSKLIGRIFEMLTQPILEQIANKYGMVIDTPDSQNTYPDFIMHYPDNYNDMIAIDVKTTYINKNNSPIVFTLGSYCSYLRDNTKNIAYSYTQYSKHYVIGFTYKRNDSAQESRVYHYLSRMNIVPPYTDVQYFMQEKYKIVGDKPGSGNTENIGSFKSSDINDYINGNGYFSQLGSDVCDMYWSHYPKYRAEVKPYTNLQEFVVWFLNTDPRFLDLIYPYNYQEMKNRIFNYGKCYGII